MREYLLTQGYTILRWAEPVEEDTVVYEVVSPWGELVRADREWLLLPLAPIVHLPLAA